MTSERARFDALAAAWVASRRSANTRAAYRADLARFLVWWDAGRRLPPLAATAADLARFEQACVDAGASAATIARRRSALSSFFAFAVARGAVRRSPVTAAPSARPPAGPTMPTADLDAAQVARVVGASELLGDRARILVALLLFDGLRLAEIVGADASDVSITPETAQITVARHGQPAAVSLDPRTATAVTRYLDGRSRGPLLLGESPTRPPGRLTRFGADHLLKRISAAAGLVPPISANTLRRHYVAGAHARGASIESIRDRLGHRDVRTTRRHLTDDARQDPPET